jgi:hypothetical protein
MLVVVSMGSDGALVPTAPGVADRKFDVAAVAVALGPADALPGVALPAVPPHPAASRSVRAINGSRRRIACGYLPQAGRVRRYAGDVTYEELLDLAHRLADQPLTTPTGREFTVSVYLDCPVFIPASTGLGRSDGRKAAERFLERYNATGSRRPSDYGGVTRNASYFLGMLAAR